MSCGWEGNRRFGVTVTMRHRFNWFIHLHTRAQLREMSSPDDLINTPLGVWYSLPFLRLKEVKIF